MSAVLEKPVINEFGISRFVLQFSPVVELTDEQFFEFCQANRDVRIERTKQGEIFLKDADFGNKFEKTFGSSSHPETTLDIYYDNYGLRCEVTKKSTDSGFREGKLRQIKYGFSKSNYKKYVKKK